MTDDNPTDPPNEPVEQKPPYVIEGARSSRSKCKSCRRTINKDTLRLGMLVEGRFGVGYMWHHLNCAARRSFERVEEAYELEAWKEAKIPPDALPDLAELQKLVEKSEKKKAERKEIPCAELDPSGRAKCKHCGEPIEKGSLRVTLGREVEFGSQLRVGPINVHPRCVARELVQDDCATEPEDFFDALRANSALSDDQLDQVVAQIGKLI